MEKGLSLECISQTDSVGSSHANVRHMKMYLWLLTCRDQGDLADFIPFPPWNKSYRIAAVSAFQQGNCGEWLSEEWLRAVLKCLEET